MKNDILDKQDKHTVDVDHSLVVQSAQHIDNNKKSKVDHQPHLLVIERLGSDVGD